MALSGSRIKRYYDRFGSKQDSQGFYEEPAINRLIAHSTFEQAKYVVELGCGTGKLAERLLAEHLPPDATYAGIDISETMVRLATERLRRFGDRASVTLSYGGAHIPVPDKAADRVVSTYVLDLLSEDEIALTFREAHRALRPNGSFCCASLARGTHLGTKLVSGLWSGVYRVAPALVGGCRPISFTAYIDERCWKVHYREVVAPFGLPSEVIVLFPLQSKVRSPSAGAGS